MGEDISALIAFKKLLSETDKPIPGVPVGIEENEYHLRFLRAKNMNIEKAVEIYRRYHEMRTKYNDTFRKMLPSNLKHILESGVVTKLSGTDTEGRAVFLFRFKLWNPKEIPMDQIYLACVLILEEISCIQEYQEKGIVMIHDYEGFEFSHFRQFTMHNFIKILQIMQGKFPLKFKAYHEVNQTYLFDILYKLFYPLVSHKLRKRIFMHGSDMESLASHFPLTSLPNEFGGTAESYSDIPFLDRLVQRERYYEHLASSLT